MMYLRRGFTILELMLAMGLSCMVMVGVIQLYQVVAKQLDFARDVMNSQRTASLLLKQLRADLVAAFIPVLEKSNKQQQDGSPVTQIDKEREQEEERERYKNTFVLTHDEMGDTVKIEGKRLPRMTQLSFVTTNAFCFYGAATQRYMRVVYELKLDKKRSKPDHQVFVMLRKETTEITNHAAKSTDEKPVKSFVVAENIKGVYVQCSLFKRDVGDPKVVEKHKNDNERLQVLRWGDVPQTQGVVPVLVQIWLELWTDIGHDPVLFSTAAVIGCYPALRTDSNKKAPAPSAQPASDPNAPGAQPAAAGQNPQDPNAVQAPQPAPNPVGT